MAKHKVWVFFVDLQFTIPNQTLRRQVQGLHGLEHYELVNIGALQNSCELPDDPEIFLYSILDEPSMNFPPPTEAWRGWGFQVMPILGGLLKMC